MSGRLVRSARARVRASARSLAEMAAILAEIERQYRAALEAPGAAQVRRGTVGAGSAADRGLRTGGRGHRRRRDLPQLDLDPTFFQSK